MTSELTSSLRLQLEDVLGSLQHARRHDDLGRLALLTYWEVRKWARCADRHALATLAAGVFTTQPLPSRQAFLAVVDEVIAELDRIRLGMH